MAKFKIWLLILLNFLLTFGTPIGVGYALFAKDIKAHKGGAFFYLVIAVTLAVFVKKISIAIRKMKASNTKAVFKVFMSLLVLYALYVFVVYIGVNFSQLSKLILLTIAGRFLAFIVELIALKLNKEYIEEIGVM